MVLVVKVSRTHTFQFQSFRIICWKKLRIRHFTHAKRLGIHKAGCVMAACSRLSSGAWCKLFRYWKGIKRIRSPRIHSMFCIKFVYGPNSRVAKVIFPFAAIFHFQSDSDLICALKGSLSLGWSVASPKCPQIRRAPKWCHRIPPLHTSSCVLTLFFAVPCRSSAITSFYAGWGTPKWRYGWKLERHAPQSCVAVGTFSRLPLVGEDP